MSEAPTLSPADMTQVGAGIDAAAVACLQGATPLTPAPRPVFAGLTVRELSVLFAFLVVFLWAAWATRELLALKERRIVSVSLATMVQSFVAAEARRGASQGEAAARTRAYLGAIDGAMRAISSDGTTVLVSEAVLGNSVPDVTQTVMKAVNARIGLSPAPAQAPGQPAAAAIPQGLTNPLASAPSSSPDAAMPALAPVQKAWVAPSQMTAEEPLP